MRILSQKCFKTRMDSAFLKSKNLQENNPCRFLRHNLVPLAGIELATFALRMRCSTN
jgi:hypothetical protein